LIDLVDLHVGADAEALVINVLRSGRLAQGPYVAAAEETFARIAGSEHAVATSSGSTALVAALEAVGVGPGSEVVTSPLTFVATLNAILEVGATARFADVDDETLTVDPASVEALVTERTAAMLPVHLYGLPADMDALCDIARRHDVHVIEDAAQAHGASVAGRPAGGFGVGCFSFYATKNVFAGEGGMVTTSDAAIADRVRLLRNHGMRAPYEYETLGHNFRMTEMQAALLSPQLARLGEINEARRRNAEHLTAGLAGLPGLRLPTEPHTRQHVWHQYTVRVTEEAAVTRDELRRRLRAAGVGSAVYYPALVHAAPCHREHPRVVLDPTPRAAEASARVLSLPVHDRLQQDDLDHVVDAVRKALA
jgi:perosamine synthetase